MLLAVVAHAGPIPKVVLAVITAAAAILDTPNCTRILKRDAISSKLKPAAEGIAINKICEMGITMLANI